MEGRGLENFQKKQKHSKFHKCPKSFPKVCKRVLNMFWGKFFEKFFLPRVPWRVGFSKISKKNRKNSKFQKCPKSFPKVSKRVFNKLWGDVFENFFAQCSISVFLDFKLWVQIPELGNTSSVFRHNTQQTFFLHSRHSQYTQSHFRISGLKIMTSDSST